MKRWKGTEPATRPALTPEALEADPTLTDAEKARVYDDLFEYHGDEDHDGSEDDQFYDDDL